MIKQGDQNIQVTKEDQQQINCFSKLNQTFNEKQAQLKVRKEILEQMDDAVTELELMDEEDSTSIKFGDCFFRANVSQAQEYLDSRISLVKSSQNQLLEESEETSKKIKKLKASLYAKFGSQINLEEE